MEETEFVTTPSSSPPAPKKNCRREADISQESIDNYESDLKELQEVS